MTDEEACRRAAYLMRHGAERRETEAVKVEARATHPHMSSEDSLRINTLRFEASTLRHAAAIIVREDRP